MNIALSGGSAPINLIKCIYVFSRYLIILFQTANSVIVTTHMYKVPISDTACFYWTSAQTGVTVFSLTLLEVILMLRGERVSNDIPIFAQFSLVYALHGKSRYIGMMLICSLTAGVSSNIVASVMTLRELNADDACVARDTPGAVFAFGSFFPESPPSAACISQQLLIWGLTFKRWSFLQTVNNAGQRISRVVVRDGTWVLIGVCAFMSITIPYSVYIDQVTHVMFSIVIPLFSISTCRLIINMQCLNDQISSTNSHELTSIEISGTVSQISQSSRA
ncbi:hypothetical protein AMATHDRAFT_49692 [Amanita thiersii Skay4041]|uniref:Glucose receptor Git3 N-terminal domain-containing protein n=1 Tax=Amanita thiersii Skay4041 TaxID=703135 RepID=A0A2A9NKG3_9AGAR|nr:hypothetical protein AMATHDRAFT_49692 [Amanita thiersii Skay4041]